MERRTDLAIEQREMAGEDVKGVSYEKEEKNGVVIERMKVVSEKAARALKKPIGSYITITLPPLTDNIEHTDKRLFLIADQLRSLIPVNGPVLVAGLGNAAITPDALGVRTAERVLATRHIRGEIARSTGLSSLRSVAVIASGVTGKTGIETAELLLGIVRKIRPSAVVAVDALASRELSRLGRTLQLCDTGIAPGAGVGNHRTELNENTLGVPVIGVGVPTVVDAFTMAGDLIEADDEETARSLREKVSPKGREMVVTPREIDLLVERASTLLSLSINVALQKEIEPEQLFSLL